MLLGMEKPKLNAILLPNRTHTNTYMHSHSYTHTHTHTAALYRAKHNQYVRYIKYFTVNLQGTEKTTKLKEA